MRSFKNTTLELPGGMISLPVGIASALDKDGSNGRLDRALRVEVDDEVHYRPIGEVEVDSVTREPIEEDDDPRIVYGLWEGETFRACDSDEYAQARAAAVLKTIEIEEFISADRLDSMLVKGAYYLQPRHGFESVARGMRLLWDGMRLEKQIAVAKVCLRDRQARAVIVAHPNGALVLLTLYWQVALREPDEVVLAPQEVKVRAPERRLARELVRTFATDGERFETMHDDLHEALDGMIERATPEPAAARGQAEAAADVMAQIEATLAAAARRKKAAA